MPESVLLPNLDEAAMLKVRDDLVSTGCRYNLLRMNCSSFAAALLEAGCGRPPSFVPAVHPKEYAGNTFAGRKLSGLIVATCGPLCIWTPEQLMRYARELPH